MKKLDLLLILLCILLTSSKGWSQEESFDIDLSQLEIPHTKYVLSNGLTLIVHEDRKAPIVAVNVWYHVGSKNEPEGRSGFAHLFEHLMFNGSEHMNTDYFQVMESIGATTLNGTTNFDRTNYFQNVPTSALDIALWMESDRMGHFKGAISQERLDEQRGVVQNEKRQGENQPYGKDFDLITSSCFPKGHPYNHTVIGSMDDLNSAELEDVKKWFTDYYGAANAVVVIAGDISPEDAYEKVVASFGDIPSGPPVTTYKVNIAKRTGEIRQVQQDRVPQSRVFQIYNVPEWGNKDAILLDFVASALTSGKNSRLYKRLVYDEQIATDVDAYNYENEIAGLFGIEADVKPGVDNMIVEKAVKQELQKLLQNGLTAKELNRIKTQYFADFVRGMEGVGGFGGKSDIIAQNQVFMNDPSYYMTRLQVTKDATLEEIKSAANRWLSDGVYTLHINPFPDYSQTGSDVDRSEVPKAGPDVNVSFPTIEKATLSNGMEVMLAQRSAVPMVEVSIYFDAGFAADQYAKPGTAALTMNMLDEGTKNRDALQINDDLAMLGAILSTGSNLDQSFISISALTVKFEESLSLMADVILNPSFPQNDFDRLQKQQVVEIQKEKSIPIRMALRTLPKLLYGEDHGYSNPLTGSGYEESVLNISRDDLIKFYSDWIKPNNATVVAVGDITMDELTKSLEKQFKTWNRSEVPKKNLSSVSGDVNRKKIFLMDKPDAEQSVIIGAYLTDPYGTGDEAAIRMMNNILGGEFTSRVNMNLREDKGWAYGARTILYDAQGQRPYFAYAPVQTDKTAPSMTEIVKEFETYVSSNQATDQEFQKTRKNEILSLNGQYEKLSSIENSVASMVRYKLPEDYYKKYPEAVRSLSLNQIKSAANSMIDADRLTWIVVGDRAKIEAEIRELGLGEVIPIDSDGNVLSPGNEKIKVEGN